MAAFPLLKVQSLEPPTLPRLELGVPTLPLLQILIGHSHNQVAVGVWGLFVADVWLEVDFGCFGGIPNELGDAIKQSP